MGWDLETARSYAGILREAGLEVGYATWHTVSRAGKVIVERVSFRIEGELTFEKLARASELMGTRRIDITCNLGCGSDRSHDTDLVFWNPDLFAKEG